MADARSNLVDALAQQIGVPTLSSGEVGAVLALAAIAAHGTGDRTAAPLVSFLAGTKAAQAQDRIRVLDELRHSVAELAPGEATPPASS
jgi:Domain of unknown function (DUF6457)